MYSKLLAALAALPAVLAGGQVPNPSPSSSPSPTPTVCDSNTACLQQVQDANLLCYPYMALVTVTPEPVLAMSTRTVTVFPSSSPVFDVTATTSAMHSSVPTTAPGRLGRRQLPCSNAADVAQACACLGSATYTLTATTSTIYSATTTTYVWE